MKLTVTYICTRTLYTMQCHIDTSPQNKSLYINVCVDIIYTFFDKYFQHWHNLELSTFFMFLISLFWHRNRTTNQKVNTNHQVFSIKITMKSFEEIYIQIIHKSCSKSTMHTLSDVLKVKIHIATKSYNYITWLPDTMFGVSPDHP